MRKQKKLIESLKGNGKVYKGGISISDVHYTLSVWQEYYDDIPGQKEINGVITVMRGQKDISDGSVYILKLADERKWQFFARSGNPIKAIYEVVNASGSDLTK
jgi:hypothetical protein